MHGRSQKGRNLVSLESKDKDRVNCNSWVYAKACRGGGGVQCQSQGGMLQAPDKLSSPPSRAQADTTSPHTVASAGYAQSLSVNHRIRFEHPSFTAIEL